LPVVSLALLDVIGAYDNTAHERLLHYLRRKGLGKVIPWVRAFLSDWSTRICMPEGLAERVPTPTGIPPQGSPLSPILYLFYNAGPIESCTEQETRESAEVESLKRTVAYGWVDDVSCLAAGMSEEETVAKLQVVCRRGQDWATKHASVFAPSKYNLLHFINPQTGVQPKLTQLPLDDGILAGSRALVCLTSGQGMSPKPGPAL
jgi:hypothetical protein